MLRLWLLITCHGLLLSLNLEPIIHTRALMGLSFWKLLTDLVLMAG